MSLLIPITGVDQNYLTPGNYAEILFAQGPATASAPSREVVFVMPMLSTGTWSANTLYSFRSEQDVVTGAGPGSPLHRAARIFLRGNQIAKCWAIPVAETTGGSPAAATFTITFATTPTGQGTAIVSFGPDDASYTFTTSDTITTIGDGIVAAIKALQHCAWTASNNAGTVTVTAKLKGKSQYTASYGGSRAIRTSITSGIGTTMTMSAVTDGVEGSTTEAAQFATAIASINATRKYYIVSSSWDATALANLKTHITNKSVPRSGLRSVGICAFTGTKANAITTATGLNYTRLQLAVQTASEFDPAELAGQMAAIRHLRESVDSAYNFDGYRTDGWQVPAVYATSSWTTGDDQNDMINAGITPIASDNSGSYVVMSCTTRSKNDAGTVNDRRALQSHRVSVSDDFTDTWLQDLALNFGAKKLVDDERLPDGTINTNQKLIRGVVRPSMLKGNLFKLLDDFEAIGKIQESAKSKASVQTNKVGGRVEMGVDLHVIDWLDTTTTRVAEVSTG